MVIVDLEKVTTAIRRTATIAIATKSSINVTPFCFSKAFINILIKRPIVSERKYNTVIK